MQAGKHPSRPIATATEGEQCRPGGAPELSSGSSSASSGSTSSSSIEVGAITVLGIDPGTQVLGYGAVRATRPNPSFITAGVIAPKRSPSLPERLGVIAAELESLMAEVHPSVVVVERAFTGRNVQSALRLGEARGVALACAARAGAAVVEITPAEAKRSVAGSGAADKEQVAAMVLRLLGLRDPGGPRDATDALALALAHTLRSSSPAL